MKVCTLCGKTRKISSFHKRSRAKDGLSARCKFCISENMALRYKSDEARRLSIANRRHMAKSKARSFVLDYLKVNPCTDCGYTNPIALEFDHVIGTKRADVSAMVSDALSVEAIAAEIQKCQVVCANCHRIRTNARANWYRHVDAEALND